MLHTYYQFPDHYSLLREYLPSKSTATAFYDQMIPESLAGYRRREVEKSQINLLFSESDWWKNKRVYYNVHPRMIEILDDLKMPDLPANMIRFPFTSFVVQFPQDEPSLRIDEHRCLKSAICHYTDFVVDADDLTTATDPDKLKIDDQYKRIMIYFDFNEKMQRLPLFSYKQLVWDDNDTIQQAYDKFKDDERTTGIGGKIPSEFVMLGTRIVLSVGFLAQERNPLVQPHYLTADIQKAMTANEEQKKALIERAIHRRHNQLGYIVGDDRYIPAGKRLGDIQSVGPHEITGRKLKYQHIVGIHWKTVRFGPNHEMAEPRLILPYRRGEGLPFRN